MPASLDEGQEADGAGETEALSVATVQVHCAGAQAPGVPQLAAHWTLLQRDGGRETIIACVCQGSTCIIIN